MVDHMSAEELLAAPAKDKGGRPRGPADRELALSLVFEVRARRFDASKKGKALSERGACREILQSAAGREKYAALFPRRVLTDTAPLREAFHKHYLRAKRWVDLEGLGRRRPGT